MVYEAFQADVINNVIDYVKNKIGKKSNISNFISELKSIQSVYDITLSNIESSEVKYVPTKKAESMVPDESTTYSDKNPNKVYNIKFWFSIEDGYLGKTGTGNYSLKPNMEGKNKPFNDEELDYIKKNIIKTGYITPVYDYNLLKNGDQILGYFSDYRNYDYLALGKLFIDNGVSLYAIQNVAAGSQPDYSEDWRQWGSQSWSLGSPNSPNSDHRKLHKYTPGIEELSYSSNSDNKEFYIMSNGKLDESNIPSYNEIADFVIVFELDTILDKSEIKLSTIKSGRKEVKSGATALLTDEEIRQMNVKKYFDKILSKMVVKNPKSTELNNLQKVVKDTICNKYAFISIFSNKPSIYFVREFSINLYDFIEKPSEDKYNYVKDFYLEIKKSSEDYRKKYDISMDIINNQYAKLKPLFVIVNQISDEIINYINSLKIDNIDDLYGLYYKIRSINQLANDDRFRLSNSVRGLLNDFLHHDDVDYYCDRIGNNSLSDDIKKLKDLQKSIRFLLK